MVDEEYRKYMSMNNENDIIAHFTIQGPHPFFICLLWKMLVETNRITPIAYKWVFPAALVDLGTSLIFQSNSAMHLAKIIMKERMWVNVDPLLIVYVNGYARCTVATRHGVAPKLKIAGALQFLRGTPQLRDVCSCGVIARTRLFWYDYLAANITPTLRAAALCVDVERLERIPATELTAGLRS